MPVNESIVVVRSSIIEGLNISEGASVLPLNEINKIISYLSNYSEVVNRDSAEGNPNYRQLIPYIVINYKHTYFSALRTKLGGDSRLHGKRIAGFGGHMNPLIVTDTSYSGSLNHQIILNADRELDEELIISDTNSTLTFRGFINDLSSPVSRDHFGIYLTLDLSTPNVTVNETSVLTDAYFMTKEELMQAPTLENWSKLLLPLL